MQPEPTAQQPDMAAFAHVKDERLRGLLAHYLSLRQGRRAPRRSQISPLDFPQLLSSVFLYERTDDGADYHIRLAGEEVARMLQTTRAGSRLSEVFPADAMPLVAERFRHVSSTLSVMHNSGRVFQRLGGTGIGERIVMPLLDDMDEPRFLLGATVYALPAGDAAPAGDEPATITYTPL